MLLAPVLSFCLVSDVVDISWLLTVLSFDGFELVGFDYSVALAQCPFVPRGGARALGNCGRSAQ